MRWETVIGLETHAQLSTVSKIFSGAATQFGAAPNAQACAVDIALPGVLPVLNRAAVEKAIRFGLAVGANISRRSVFARKNYFYPDLPKGYQISQYELPLVLGGSLSIVAEGGERTVRLTRAHLEEDAGKSLHEDFHGMSGIDLNRAGTPLLEIVTEPDMRSAGEAVAYAKGLHTLVRWIGICDGNMQEGSFRCDANVSVRPRGSKTLGTRSEIKNLNSFRFLEEAINYEVRRQVELLEDGGKIVQETRLYDPDKKETRSMRSKEDAHDYRYFPDPDLLPLEVTDAWLEEVRASLPELPQAKRARYQREFELSAYDAAALTADRGIAEYFEETARLLAVLANAVSGMQQEQAKQSGIAKLVSNWVTGDLAARVNSDQIDIGSSPVPPGKLARLLVRLVDQSLSNKIAKEVFAAMWSGEQMGDADAIITTRGLKQISDSGELEKIIDGVLAAHPKSVEEFRAGKEKAFNALVGQAMKATGGKGNPAQINQILKKKLAG